MSFGNRNFDFSAVRNSAVLRFCQHTRDNSLPRFIEEEDPDSRLTEEELEDLADLKLNARLEALDEY